MFKIESFLSSIILANADKYIKNFRKQDAQVSLWEGDLTFHNIELNVDALNEELQSSFTFTSGYIHDLAIHVPWTKLMSEPVVISVNTIECVVRLKSKDEKRTSFSEKTASTSSTEYDNNEKRPLDEAPNHASYMSTVTSKIMNNLSVVCENVILKLVEEDIVFSMNIEKLKVDNVNELWIQTMTDINTERLLTRKLITLSGVTICLDKQNSSGRIDTYLEPLLYRCLITIRLLRAHDRNVSKKPVYTRFDILSDKMSFTVSEPQIPMLLKLGFMVYYNHQSSTITNSKHVSNTENISVNADSVDFTDNNEANKDYTSWGTWMWNMVPSILYQEDDISQYNKVTEVNSVFHIGFFVKHLETNLKCSTERTKKNSKAELENLVKGNFTGCCYQMTMKNSTWLNVQLGVNYVSLETLYQEKETNQIKQFFSSGNETNTDFLKDTLFDEKNLVPVEIRPHSPYEEKTYPESTFSDLDFNDENEFSIEKHLNVYTEHTLLEKTAAFAIDYLKTYRIVILGNRLDTEEGSESSNYFEEENKLRKIQKDSLVRLVFGSATLRLSSDVIDRMNYLHKIIPYREYLNLNTPSGRTDGTEVEAHASTYIYNYTTQFTFFDLTFELHALPSSNQKKVLRGFPETSLEQSPVLNLSLKCVDGKIVTTQGALNGANEEPKKIISLKAVEINSSMARQDRSCKLLRLEKFDLESFINLEKEYQEVRVETKNLSILSSKPNLLLSYNMLHYIMYSIYQQEQKLNYFAKIFYSSIIEDFLAPENPVLEVEIGRVLCTYAYTGRTENINVAVNSSKMYINKIQDNVPKKTLLFSTVDSAAESSDIRVMLQRCSGCDDICSYPSCLWFNIRNLKINLDASIYDWLMYTPVTKLPDKIYTSTSKTVKESTLNKSTTPSRKISDCSSGSHGRRFVSNYPKPKESVHSSSEAEVLSPPVATETETSDVFVMPTTGFGEKKKVTFLQYLTNNFELWRSFIVQGELSQIIIYIPTGSTLYDNESENIEYIVKEVFRNSGNQELKQGVFVFSLKSCKIKCDVPLNGADCNGILSIPKDTWSSRKLTFPWILSLSEMSFSTLLEGCACRPLLKPLSVDCTIGVSIKEGANNGSVIALCVHSDFQPIYFMLTYKQIVLITHVITTLKTFYSSTKEPGMTLNYGTDTESKTSMSYSEIPDGEKDKQQNCLTGWIQWTFTKCSIVLYSNDNHKMKKMCIEAEDSIMSLEFDDVFHKMKLKIASFGIYHYQRSAKTDTWQNGAFHGFVIQKCYAPSVNLGKKTEEENDDRFTVITITRARSSNLKNRLAQVQTGSEVVVSGDHDHFVTEIILKICPVDIVLPLTIIEVFLTVLEPIKKLFYSSDSTKLDSEAANSKDTAFSCLPLVYFDMPMIRLFVPSTSCEVDGNAICDTFICEVGSIYVNCDLENPIIRKQLHPEIYYRAPGKKNYLNQKLQSQQYQVYFSDISINTGIWAEIEEMLSKEQLSVEEPPSAFEQNPAVMWNQGCHPDSKNKIHLRHLLPVISKFSCHALVAPPTESSYSLKTVVHSAYYEVNVLSDLNVTISILQSSLLVSLCKEGVKCLAPHLRKGKLEVGVCQVPVKINSAQCKLTDSGIESMDQSSIESSSVFKVKSESGVTHQVNLKPQNSTAASNTSAYQSCRSVLRYYRYEYLKEIYITAQNIRVTLYDTNVTEENNEPKNVYDALLFVEIVQPYMLLSNENNYSSVQFSLFSTSIKVPNLKNPNRFVNIPSVKAFSKTILYVKKNRCDPYSRIKSPCLEMKTFSNLNQKQKIEICFGQTFLIDCDVDIIQYIFGTFGTCNQNFETYLAQFESINNKRDQCVQTTDPEIKTSSFKNQMEKISNLTMSTSRIAIVFKYSSKARDLILNVDGMNIKTSMLNNIRNPAESVSIQWGFRSVSLSLPETRNANLSDIFPDDETSNGIEDILSNMILKPWNVNFELQLISHRWSLFKDNPWSCLKMNSENIVLEVNPLYLNYVTVLVSEYVKLSGYFGRGKREENLGGCCESKNVSTESYKDDLRAGAFQYIKIQSNNNELPSPYEVIFCNRFVQPYMSWKYPQPRSLIKLQIYPVPVEDVNEDYIEEEIYCQLQYYDEIRCAFLPYVSFKLSENTIQNVNLPSEKPSAVAAECWRIILYDNADLQENYNNYRIDVRSLAGCVRVDSVFNEDLISGQHFLMNITEIQINLSTLSQVDNVTLDRYTVNYVPMKQHFLSLISSDIKALLTKYKEDKNIMMEVSGVNKANILNYEYLMFQSFVDPFSIHFNLYFEKDSTPKLTGIIKNVQMRISPNFIHTLTVSRDLWSEWKMNSVLPWRVTAPYVICNNTNHVVIFQQENTEDKTYLSPFWCHLYSLHNPASPKAIKITVSMEKKYTAAPINIKEPGYNTVKCVNDQGTESAHLYVSVVKHSSVVNRVIICGNLMLYNLTSNDMDMCVVSHGKRDSKFSSSQVLNATTVLKDRLLSILVPDQHKLSFKVRYTSSQSEDHCHWSGLIPLVASQQYSNQDSWMVKIPLKNHKEHFQSIWCQVTREICGSSPKYLVVFRPLCSITSFLPWKSEVRILNDVGAHMNTCCVSDKGATTDVFIPDTVTLDKYIIEWRPSNDVEKCVSKVTIEKTPKQKSNVDEYSIQSLIDEIVSERETNNWPYLSNEIGKCSWRTDRVYEMTPKVKVIRKEADGCGTKIEIHPWAIIVNMLTFRILLDISDTIYEIESYEIIAPPCIEGTFKLGIVDGTDHLSGILQLSDDQSFPIPKVTGRIPMNGFVTTMVDCDTYVAFVNITSRNHMEMRVISMYSSYVICNNSSFDISCAALVVCRTGNKSTFSFDIPSDLAALSINLLPKQSSNVGQPITKWHKIGTGDVQVLPYVILTINGNVGCPIRICDLSEKVKYPVTFSSDKSDSKRTPPCIFVTAQQNEGQVFLTVWEEKTPQIIIHNMSLLSLDIISSKSDRASDDICHCPDWNWKFTVNTMSTASFHIHQHISEKNVKKVVNYLKFSVQTSKPVKQTKWSHGVSLNTCVNRLITLPLSQHHIKLAIFKDGFTFIVWIESATADELSAKMIRARLSESFIPIDGKSVVSNGDNVNNVMEDCNEIPLKLQSLYNFGTMQLYETNVLIQQISIVAACDNNVTFEEEDIATFCAENVTINFKTNQKPNEVNEDILLYVDIRSYQLDNDQYHLRSFDFPVVLLSKPTDVADEDRQTPHLNNLLLSFTENKYSALKVILTIKNNKLQSPDVRDVELILNSQNVFLEDKYLSKIKLVLENVFSAVLDSSILKSCVESCNPKSRTSLQTTPNPDTANVDRTNDISSKLKSSSSKSVNVSKSDIDDKSFTSASVVESNSQSDECVPYTAAADSTVDETETEAVCAQRYETQNYVTVPNSIVKLSRMIARPLRLRNIRISSFKAVVSLHTSTTFYIALDRSPLSFSEFRRDYLVTTPFELGNLVFVHYFFGAIYGTGWAISSLEFVGSPGVLARTLGTGIKDFVSLPLYGIASGPRGFVLGVAHGSASLMKHVIEGTLSSVTKFAGSWARTLDRFTLDQDDLLQSEEIRRFPPSNIAEGVLQGLTEFGISVLGGISGIAHHPLQYYAVSNTKSSRSLINSISLGIVGVITRPLSGAAELVAKTGQGILSHVGWSALPMVRNNNTIGDRNFSYLQISTLKYQWKRGNDEALFAIEAVNAENITITLWITLTSRHLKIIEMTYDGSINVYSLQSHEFADSEEDPTLVTVLRPILNYKNAEDFCKARIMKFISESNRYCKIESSTSVAENVYDCSRKDTVYKFCVNPQAKVFLLTMISFIKNMFE